MAFLKSFSKHYILRIQMTFKIFVFLLFLQLTTQSIFIALKPKVPRCMVEYIASKGSVNSMKIKVQFPMIQNQVAGQHFHVSLRNTENQHVEPQIVKSGGKYYKQAEFEANVVYELCIIFRTDRDIEAVIEYEAESRYEDAQTFATAAYPEHLLKKDDFKDAFISAAHIAKTINEYTQEHKSRNNEQYKQFSTLEIIANRLNWVSIVEMIVLLGAGIYQFFALRNYLQTKQYI